MKQQGHDGTDPQDRIYGEVHGGKIYLVQESIHSEAEAEEIFFHERQHAALRRTSSRGDIGSSERLTLTMRENKVNQWTVLVARYAEYNTEREDAEIGATLKTD
ncbi:MAG: hypothetical protein EPN34_02400 [Burkholderiaceae bacterium]|nr:MAG: hypothetical protein EPN34_02400 [Burkholderiaceae bacterium]